MVPVRDELPLSRPTRNGRVSGRGQDQLGLLTRRQRTKVPQEVAESQLAWQMRLAEAPQHPPAGLAERKQTLGPILVPVPAGILWLRMLDELMPVARHGPVAPGRVRIAPPARTHCDRGGLLPGLHRESSGPLEDDSALATAPRNTRGPGVVIMAPAGLALLALATPPAAPRLLAAPGGVALVAGGVIEGIGRDWPVQLALSFVSQGGLAAPPTPALARADRAPALPGDAPRGTGQTPQQGGPPPMRQGTLAAGAQRARAVVDGALAVSAAVAVAPWPGGRRPPGPHVVALPPGTVEQTSCPAQTMDRGGAGGGRQALGAMRAERQG
jgi:hypothetical protein